MGLATVPGSLGSSKVALPCTKMAIMQGSIHYKGHLEVHENSKKGHNFLKVLGKASQ